MSLNTIYDCKDTSIFPIVQIKLEYFWVEPTFTKNM